MPHMRMLGPLLSTLLAAPAFSAADQPEYRPPEAWVIAPPPTGGGASSADAPIKPIYVDMQVRITADGTEKDYTASRFRILKPEALSIGNLTMRWQPDSGSLTIHRVEVIRGQQTIDVLAATKFTVLQREAQLEQSTLSGERTATLQVPGLQVGDELVVAATVTRREPAFGGHVANTAQLPVNGTPGVFRVRLTLPHDRALTVRPSSDLPPLRRTSGGEDDTFEYTLRDPSGAIPTEGAPPRYNIRRLIEFTDFDGWTDVSARIAPLFARSAKLDRSSPIRAEAAAIAAGTKDQAGRALAALQLVENQIRYVFVGLNGGNYMPAAASETWVRRYGDCKAKTVLLIALLHELGIEATPALVLASGGDGLDERLPSPKMFDHVVVRAVIDGKEVWLDGTRLGDRSLDTWVPPFRWALPLLDKGAPLERLALRDVVLPQFTGVADIDQSAGMDQDARVTIEHLLRGDEAFAVRMRLVGMTKEDADRAVKSYWSSQVGWLTVDQVGWSYDDRQMALTLRADGRGNPGWKGTPQEGHWLDLMGGGFFEPAPLRRPQDQDQAAPWSVAFPSYRCWATTIRLPKAGSSFGWQLTADAVYRKLAGTTYWRASGQEQGIVRVVTSVHTYEAEASPREAALLNKAIPTFNSDMARIAELKDATGKRPLPFGSDVDWLHRPAPCTPGG